MDFLDFCIMLLLIFAILLLAVVGIKTTDEIMCKPVLDHCMEVLDHQHNVLDQCMGDLKK